MLIGLFIAASVALGSDQWARWQDESVPITNWVDFPSIYVPDFVIGDEDKTNVIFKVIRKKSITDNYTLQVIPILPNAHFLCFKSGIFESKAGDTLPATGFPLTSLFPPTDRYSITQPCQWYEGDFKLEQTITLDDGYMIKKGSWDSNIFHVLPRGAQKYVKPEQVQTLEKLK